MMEDFGAATVLKYKNTRVCLINTVIYEPMWNIYNHPLMKKMY